MTRPSWNSAAAARLLSLTRLLSVALVLLCLAQPGRAQGQLWVQIEARPTLAGALERAAAWASAFEWTRGFRLRSGWYAIALGPYDGDGAVTALDRLKRENLIPLDSYITDGSEYGDSFWPPALDPEAAEGGAETAAAPDGTAAGLAPAGEAMPDGALPGNASPDEAGPDGTLAGEAPAGEALAGEALAGETAPDEITRDEPDETAAEARASEAALDAGARMALQTALRWFGFYEGAIDGAFGPATRASMAAWQGARGLEPTGILTTRQRADLLAAHEGEVAAFGFDTVTDAEAGISAILPLALVEFDRYDPPFVHFRARDGSGLTILLISEPGGTDTLAGLYDLLQSLDAVPKEGARSLSGDSFRIEASSPAQTAHAFARLKGAAIKGWLVLSRPETAARDARVLEVLGASFSPAGDAVLDPGMVMLDEAVRRGLVAGLELRKPRLSRSGMFVSDDGAVLTVIEAATGCGRITIDHTVAARIGTADAGAGLALLLPERPLAPGAVATLREGAPPLGGEITLGGYPYEGRLPAPVLTWGTLEGLSGLDGEPGRLRLAIDARAGDAGGPVADAAGAVIGLLLPPDGDGRRVLPEGVAFAADAGVVGAMLAGAGIPARQAAPGDALPPETLSRRLRAMTVLVSCWDEAGP